MSTKEKLTTIDIKPNKIAEKCVIWLHGLGADGNDFAPIVPELHLPDQLGIKFIFPHAPVMPITINNGYEMRAWFDISHNGISVDIDRIGMEQSVAAINHLITEEEASGITSNNIMLAGFSQGAVIALMTGLQYPKPLAGVIALSGLLPHADQIIANGTAANRKLPIFIGHGSLDQMVPLPLSKQAYDDLVSASYPAEWHQYPMAHSVCAEEINDISKWIKQIWS